MANRWGKSDRFNFLDYKITVDGDCSHEIKTLAPGKKHYDQPRQHIKKQRHTNCEIICSSSVKNTIGSLIGIALNL